ncbi:glucosamine inositolphosphorylceramide transferase family protein [Histidinibacterium aquaticum]|uniref:Glucosamine inositolphosphorylceramide transferase 1 N-terminal domain-containing protein n=1 Tax=Histidinibacterium aquaticum TaxID=2613962 RepID=A0A5J5GMB7_9RHOB|nr:hypothetical protein [Histidinibacterium aquaticum]KAA9009431.1 hypothetical protein F3S47_09320 [Histidinibacterium aquaticum]
MAEQDAPGAASPPPGDALRVGVVLPDTSEPNGGALPMLEILCGDRRFDLVRLIEASSGDTVTVPWPVRMVLAAERRTLAKPRVHAAPSFEAKKSSVPVCGLSDLSPDETFDVVIDLSHSEDIREIADRSLHGVWRVSSTSRHAGLSEPMTGGPASIAEVWKLDASDGAWALIAQASYDVKFLAARNQDFLREKTAQLVEHVLARAAAGLPLDPDAASSPATGPAKATMVPRHLSSVTRNIGRRAFNAVAARLGWRPRRFCLRLARGGPLDFEIGAAQEFDAPAGQYWADPFLLEHEGHVYAFFEEFVYSTGLGHIVVGRLDEAGLTVLGPALKTGRHLSYPFVFRCHGEIFMLPETGSAERLEVWRCTRFPLEWELHATALEGLACADSTLLCEEDGVWLFTNICRDSFDDFGSELHIFRADGPDLKDLTPHPLNPVVVGSRRARGAGRIVRHEGRLYRPSQDNSHGTYGFGLNINEIEELSPTAYRERCVRHLTTEGQQDLIGCHHIDVLGDRVIFDVRRR